MERVAEAAAEGWMALIEALGPPRPPPPPPSPLHVAAPSAAGAERWRSELFGGVAERSLVRCSRLAASE